MNSGREQLSARSTWPFALLLALLLLTSRSVETQVLPPPADHVFSWPQSEMATILSCRVNVPRFDGSVRFSETAIFWFGQVTPTLNSVDARIGYNEDHLLVRVAAFDRRLWYDLSPSPGDLTAWDAVSLYLDTGGSVGDVPDSNAYRFDGQLVWWEAPRNDWQAAYQGDGSGWVMASLPFTTSSSWAGDAPNNDEDDRGWTLAFVVPYSTLGLSTPPAEGTIWGMAVVLHDRDDAEDTPIDDQVWPETMHPEKPATWGQLRFGIPSYGSPAASKEGEVTIRQGLDGATVMDADVGGSSVCGASAWPDYFSTWGELNWAGKTFVNIQNLGAISDWPCFSRTYVTFPLDAVPSDQVIISATLTLHLWGGAGAGYDPGPQPSLIQLFTVGEDWDESTLNWNNAPLARENVSATWVDPVVVAQDPPGLPYRWDASRAVAEAYAFGTPVRLALYEADWAYHSGKYFHSSDVGDWNAEGRPTLTVAWGRALPEVAKTATPVSGYQNDPITYTLSFVGTGQTLVLTDVLSAGIGTPGDFVVEGSSIQPSYEGDCHCVSWTDSPPLGQEITIRYTARIVITACQALWNTAVVTDSSGGSSQAAAAVLANPLQVYLPIVLKRD